jgi:hypothetical protein
MFLANGPAWGLLDGPLDNAGIPATFAARYQAEFGDKPRSFSAAWLKSGDESLTTDLADRISFR